MKFRIQTVAIAAFCGIVGCLFFVSRHKQEIFYSESLKQSGLDIAPNKQVKVNKNQRLKVKENVVQFAQHEHIDSIILPSKNIMANMTQPKLANLYHRYINSLQIFCRKITRMGKLEDGGWDICDDASYRPNKICLVYSFGINFDFSFDDAIVKKYGCEVHSFDPSMKRPDHVHGKNVQFHASGLSKDNAPSRGTNWRMRTLQQFMQELKHQNKTLDVLKVDIEEWEWLALPQMLQSGVMQQVRQFDIELHITLKYEPNKNKYYLGLSILKDLYDSGFRIFWTHRNLYCKFNSREGSIPRSGCHEVSFININLQNDVK